EVCALTWARPYGLTRHLLDGHRYAGLAGESGLACASVHEYTLSGGSWHFSAQAVRAGSAVSRRSAAWLRSSKFGHQPGNGHVLENATPAGVHGDEPNLERVIDGERAWLAVYNDRKQRAG